MAAALRGVEPNGAKGFTALDKREVVSRPAPFPRDEHTMVRQTRFRSGSITEQHMHGSKPGGLMHMNRSGQVAYLDAAHTKDLAKVEGVFK